MLARDAASADAAATMIANAVDVDDPAIARRPAREIKDDSDLGELPVTVAVGTLARPARGRAALPCGHTPGHWNFLHTSGSLQPTFSCRVK